MSERQFNTLGATLGAAVTAALIFVGLFEAVEIKYGFEPVLAGCVAAGAMLGGAGVALLIRDGTRRASRYIRAVRVGRSG